MLKKRALALLLAMTLLAAPALTARAAQDPAVTVTTLIPARYEDASGFSEGLAAVRQGGLWGYVDETGRTVIPFRYAYAGDFNGGAALAASRTEDGLALWILDKSGAETPVPASGGGQMTLKNEADLAAYGVTRAACSEGVFVFNGIVCTARGVRVEPDSRTRAAVLALLKTKGYTSAGANAVKDASGRTLALRYYALNQPCVDGAVAMSAEVGGTLAATFLMDTRGALRGSVLDPANAVLYSAPRDGLACAYTGSGASLRFGMLRDDGTWAVKPAYEGFRAQYDGVFFAGGLWTVRQGGQYGAVNASGALVIPARYDLLDLFRRGLSPARQGDEWFYIDTSNHRYAVALPGGGIAQDLALAGPFHADTGVAAVYDRATDTAYLIADTPVDGILPAVEGSEGLALSAYFPGWDGSPDSVAELRAVGDTVTFQENGKYGFYRLTLRPGVTNPYRDVLPGTYYFDAALWSARGSILSPLDASRFDPDLPASRGQIMEAIWNASGKPEPTLTVCPFADVEPTDSFYRAVLWGLERGVINGTSPTAFSPDLPTSRAAIVTMLYRLAGSPGVSGEPNPFKDVPPDRWYTAPILWALREQITNGTDASHFSPDAPCARAQLITFLYRQLGK